MEDKSPLERKPSTRDLVEALQKDVPRAGISDVKRKMAEGGSVNPDTALKAEVNGITAFLIEKVWSEIEKQIREHPPGLSKLNITASEKESQRHFFSPNEVAAYCLHGENRSDQSLRFLKQGTSDFLMNTVIDWSESTDSNPGNHNKRAYDRLSVLLLKPEFHASSYNRSSDMKPETYINRGVLTAVSVIWETIRILPEVYKRQFNKPMALVEFNKLAKNSLPFIYSLAGSHLGVLVKLEPELRKEGRVQGHGFSVSSFHFSDGHDGLKLEINKEVIGRVKTPVNTFNEPRTGCPAMFAMGPGHKNVINEMADWFIALAEKYYLPNLKKEDVVA